MAKTEWKSPASEKLQAIVIAHEHAELGRLLREKGHIIMAEVFEKSARDLNEAIDA